MISKSVRAGIAAALLLPAVTACTASSSGSGDRPSTAPADRGSATASSSTATAKPGASGARPGGSGAASTRPSPAAPSTFKGCALLPSNVVSGVLDAGHVQGVADARAVPPGVLRQLDGCNYTVSGTIQTLGYLVWRYPSHAAAGTALTTLQALTRSPGITAFRAGLADGSIGIVSGTGNTAAVQLTVVSGDRVAQLSLGGQPTASAAQDRATAAARQLLRRL